MSRAPLDYLSYLLRLWRTGGEDRAAWRASLEGPHTGEQKGFASLDALFAFLREQTDESPPPAAGESGVKD